MGKYDVDFYDDPHGEVLRRKIPNPQDLPDFIKTAEMAVGPTHEQLPDDVFALILNDRGRVMRKFACFDKGNTALSVIYFLENAHHLPEEAQKVAALNLVESCAAYDLAVPAPLEKLAGCSRGSGQRMVDVAGKKPPRPVLKAKKHALVKEGEARYPIDDVESVSRAIAYFVDNYRDFDPFDRRMYCIKVASAADSLGLGRHVSQMMRDYAATTRAPAGHIKVAVLSRRSAFPEDAAERDVLEGLVKQASFLPPEELAATLEKFDRETGLHNRWDGAVMDPYASVFAVEKVASWSFSHQGRTITEEELQGAVKDKERVKEVLGPDVAGGLAESPVETFDSLPTPHKLIIMSMAGV